MLEYSANDWRVEEACKLLTGYTLEAPLLLTWQQ